MKLRSGSQPIWRAIQNHPFLAELHQGTLSLDRFTYFILQDYVYLLDFAQVLCQGGAKSPDLETLALFCRHALGAVEVERTFHASFGNSLGLSRKELDEVPKGPITQAYIAHLQSVARSGSLGEIVAAILPCYWIYGGVGRRIYRNRPLKSKVYSQWIETYASEAFWRPVREQIQLMNRLGKAAGTGERKVMTAHFILSSRYEFMFWEQAYRLDHWPV